MSTIPQRIASAFAVLCGKYGDVTEMALDRDQSRQSLYREAQQVAEAVDGAATQAQIEGFQRQLAERQAEFATVAQAEGVSLGVARRLLLVMTGPRSGRAVATLGRATLEAGQKAGSLLMVLDEAVCPQVKQGTADEIFLAANPS
jgi:hypothetical protein